MRSVASSEYYLSTVGNVTKLGSQVARERDELIERDGADVRGVVLAAEKTWKLEAEAAALSGLSEHVDRCSNEASHLPVGAEVVEGT